MGGACEGRRAVVTGGSRGIGAAVAAELAERGAVLTVVGRDEAALRAAATGIGADVIVGDVTDPSTVAAIARAEADIVVANAGVIGPLGGFAAVSIEEWDRAIEVNLGGAARVVHALLPGMLQRGWGRIVTISSGAADPPGMPSANAYSTSKAALDMFTIHLAAELADTGVTANAVRPGVVDTDMQVEMRAAPRERVGPEFHDRFHGLHKRGELADPAAAARYVADVIDSDLNGRVLDRRRDRIGAT